VAEQLAEAASLVKDARSWAAQSVVPGEGTGIGTAR
jgi:hypothetical protein